MGLLERFQRKQLPPSKNEPPYDGELPKVDISLPNDNTSTSGSKFPSPIMGVPTLPKDTTISVPYDGWTPADDWIEMDDQVNGQIRRTWKNKKTGRITRIKPY